MGRDAADDEAMVQIRGFLYDDVNEAKFWVHRIRPEQVDQILDDAIVVVPNRRERRGAYLVIGRDWSGACIAVPIEPTPRRGIWRPITAWPCKESEAARLARSPHRD